VKKKDRKEGKERKGELRLQGRKAGVSPDNQPDNLTKNETINSGDDKCYFAENVRL